MKAFLHGLGLMCILYNANSSRDVDSTRQIRESERVGCPNRVTAVWLSVEAHLNPPGATYSETTLFFLCGVPLLPPRAVLHRLFFVPNWRTYSRLRTETLGKKQEGISGNEQ